MVKIPSHILIPVMLFAAIGSAYAEPPTNNGVADPPVKLRWADYVKCYEFDTGKLFGCIEPYTAYHGIAGLLHSDYKVDVVRPRKSLLNAEYYLSPGSGRHMRPRKLTIERKSIHKLQDGGIQIHFPQEPVYRFAMDMTYWPHGDVIDMGLRIVPSKDASKLEIFFASYIAEAFSETWIPLKNPDGSEQWTRIESRRILNLVFGVVRDDEERKMIADGRWDSGSQRLHDKFQIEDRPFSKPVIAARNPKNGFALVFLCDPSRTALLVGQYHGWDTAHDWTFDFDLVAGKTQTATARLIYRQFSDTESMCKEIDQEWVRYQKEIGDERE